MLNFDILTQRAKCIPLLRGQVKYLVIRDLLRDCKRLLKSGGKYAA